MLDSIIVLAKFTSISHFSHNSTFHDSCGDEFSSVMSNRIYLLFLFSFSSCFLMSGLLLLPFLSSPLLRFGSLIYKTQYHFHTLSFWCNLNVTGFLLYEYLDFMPQIYLFMYQFDFKLNPAGLVTKLFKVTSK